MDWNERTTNPSSLQKVHNLAYQLNLNIINRTYILQTANPYGKYKDGQTV